MTDTLLRFEPLDSLFFRDGRPYTQGESEQVGVTSQFPSPASLVGAVRAAAARALGWPGHGPWDGAIQLKLGDGQALGPLRFRGPLLLQNEQVLFPAPASLLRSPAGDSALLQPGPPCHCDLGPAVRLPALPNGVPGGGWKAAGTDWLTHEGFAAILRGEAPGPEALVEQKNLWQLEPRVGIKRTQQTRTTAEGALYSPQHLRLGRGVCLGLWAAGLPAETLARIALTPQPVGGESRSAWITMIEQVPMWPALPKQMIQDAQGLQYTVIVLSPLPLQDVPLSGQVISGLPGTLISACMPRALMLGGWDRHQPLPLKPHLAPGTVLFMRTDSAKETTIRGLHGACIGLRPAWGYGLIAIGTWR